VIHITFDNIDGVSNIIAARILSLLTTISLVYVAFQMNQTSNNPDSAIFRLSITFFLLTVLIAGCLRVIRFVFDWRETLKEFQRWQFITALVTGAAITSSFITHFVIGFI
jgi:hypothetical protein